MAFVNYGLLEKAFPSGRMRENVRALKDFDMFHCLLAGSPERAEAVKSRVSGLPADFLTWLEICDGGMLFDTSLLSTKARDEELGLSFETFSSFNNDDFRTSMEIPDTWFTFAVAIHSDIYFFDMAKKDGQVYQWDAEEREIETIWASFTDWITDIINEAVELIANEELDPLDIKLEADDDE